MSGLAKSVYYYTLSKADKDDKIKLYETRIEVNMKVKINQRLATLATFIDDGDHLIDVGCDHALLDIYLAQNRKGLRIIASDVKEGPLKQATENVKKYQLQDKITLKLGNGIEPIEEDIDTVVISGMGGALMVGILKYQTSRLKRVKKLILSPNNDVEFVRKEIVKLGYKIERETLVLDHNFIYPIIEFTKGKKHYSQKEYLFGPLLLQEKTPLFITYLTKQKEVTEQLLAILPKKYIKRRLQLKQKLKLLNKIL
ncbi:MAG TPA: SAM-dependent methyltransferase [Candidatus Scybalousia intestinigallinarum]|nr:SAM-dependent methyltransferase [Candidatus Scybalousia intestinigallinarum]